MKRDNSGSHGSRLTRSFPVRIAGAHGAYVRDGQACAAAARRIRP